MTRSAIAGNGGAGIFETTGSSDGQYLSNQISGNGINGAPYSGDGIQLGGVGPMSPGTPSSATATRGRTSTDLRRGIARDYLIESNLLSGNAGSDIKAAGSGGVVRYNRLEGGRLGIVFSDNPTPVLAYYNVISARYQHAVFLTTGTTAARAKLWNNTIVVTGRSSDSGDASAIFVNSAASVDLRNNVVAYTNRTASAPPSMSGTPARQARSPQTTTGSRPSTRRAATSSGTAPGSPSPGGRPTDRTPTALASTPPPSTVRCGSSRRTWASSAARTSGWPGTTSGHRSPPGPPRTSAPTRLFGKPETADQLISWPSERR